MRRRSDRPVVEDLPRAKSFYKDVFGAPLVFEDESSAAFKFESLIVNLLSADSAPELIEPAAVASAAAGARFQLDGRGRGRRRELRGIAGRGVALLNGPIDRPWGIRTASFRDPGGHIWEIAK